TADPRCPQRQPATGARCRARSFRGSLRRRGSARGHRGLPGQTCTPVAQRLRARAMGEQSPVLFDLVQTASGHAFGRATLNAPAALNALSLAMIDALDPQLRAWAQDPRIVGVVLDAAGEKAFCAGGDVVALYR